MVLYAVVLTSSWVCFRLCFKKLTVLLAFFTLVLMCDFQFRFILMLFHLPSSAHPLSVVDGIYGLVLTTDCDCLTFVQVKLHS